MPRIFRFRPEAAAQLALSEAQAQGLPVQMPMVQQGFQAVISGLYSKYGIAFCIDESSPYFQHLVQGGNGFMQKLKAPQAPPQMPFPGAQMPAPAPQMPLMVQMAQMPQVMPQGPFQPQQMQAQMRLMPRPAVPGAIVPGQPLPQQMTAQFAPPPPSIMSNPGLKPGPAGPVPVQAPIMQTGEPPSLTEAQSPGPSFE
jgi:hypothetical protein